MAGTRIARTYKVSDAEHIFRRAQNFHDANFSRFHLGTNRSLEFEICNPRWVMSQEVTRLDRATRFNFFLKNVEILDSWGVDEEIGLSAIYDFSIEAGKFSFETGDGGRLGTMDYSISVVEVVSSSETIEEFDIPI